MVNVLKQIVSIAVAELVFESEFDIDIKRRHI